jgi:hypothetical protein
MALACRPGGIVYMVIPICIFTIILAYIHVSFN